MFSKESRVSAAVRRVRLGGRRRWAEHVRRNRPGTTFIAVTGSRGKTTTVCLLDAILAVRHRTVMASRYNTMDAVAKLVRTVKRRHDYALAEVSGHAPGAIAAVVEVMRPDVGIVISVADDHIKNFRGGVTVAQEKSTLVSALPETGIAVLNGDDPQVAAMRALARCPVVTFGTGKDADIRASNVSFKFPDTLEFDVTDKGETAHIVTQFTGRHWLDSALAAIAAARAMGLDFAAIARAVRAFEPIPCRCTVHGTPDGQVFILDTFKAAFDALPASFDILKGVEAPRTTIVVGNLADYVGATRPKYQKAYELARERAGRVVFMGDQAARVRPRKEDLAAGRFHVLDEVPDVERFLRETAIPGEVILMKSSVAVHLERAFLQREAPISCWVRRCGLMLPCLECGRLRAGSAA